MAGELVEVTRGEFEGISVGRVSGAQILSFFNAVDCPVQWLSAQLDGAIYCLIVKPMSAGLKECFGIDFEIPVIVTRYAEFQARTIGLRKQIEKAVVEGRLEREITIVISEDSALSDKLDKLDTLVQTNIPITPSEILAALSSESPSKWFRTKLQEKLYARDAFDRTGPVEGKEFFGRKKLLDDLLYQFSRGSSVGLYGLRKIGKTSILKNLARIAQQKQSQYVFAILDLLTAPPGNRDYHYLLWSLAKDLQSQVNVGVRTSAGLRIIGKVPRFEDVDFQKFELGFDSDLRALAKHLEGIGGRLVIVIDEIELLFPVADTRDGFQGYEDFLAYLRGLSQNNCISVMVVGVNPHISEAQFLGGQGRRNPVYNFFSNRYAPPMTQEEVREMVRVLGKSSGVKFDADAIDRLYEITGGHPALTRKYCSATIRDRPRPITVSRTDIEAARDRFLRDESSSFAEMVSVVKEHYPEEFETLTRVALSSDGISCVDVNRQIRSHLEGYQLVVERNGRLQLNNQLIKDWFQGLSRRPVVSSISGGSVQAPVSAEELERQLKQLERELRSLISTRLVRKYGVGAEKRIEKGLGEAAVTQARERRVRSLRGFQPDADPSQIEILEYLYLADLFKIICGVDWDLFREVFNGDKKKLDYSCSVLAPVRNELAHQRPLQQLDLLRAFVEIHDINNFLMTT